MTNPAPECIDHLTARIMLASATAYASAVADRAGRYPRRAPATSPGCGSRVADKGTSAKRRSTREP